MSMEKYSQRLNDAEIIQMTNPRDVEEIADMLIEEKIGNLVDFYRELIKSYQNSPTPEL
jgi:hypothetical protein